MSRASLKRCTHLIHLWHIHRICHKYLIDSVPTSGPLTRPRSCRSEQGGGHACIALFYRSSEQVHSAILLCFILFIYIHIPLRCAEICIIHIGPCPYWSSQSISRLTQRKPTLHAAAVRGNSASHWNSPLPLWVIDSLSNPKCQTPKHWKQKCLLALNADTGNIDVWKCRQMPKVAY